MTYQLCSNLLFQTLKVWRVIRLKSVTNAYGMIHKCKLRNHTGSRDVLVFQWDLEHTVQSALKALQVSERFVVCKFRHLCGQKEKMIRFVKLNLKEMSVNETDFT